MSANSVLYTGASGLRSFAEAMSIVSDNVANANTTGYKANKALFGDLVSGYLSTQSTDLDRQGCGSGLSGIATNFGQGQFLSTDSWSHVAISGDGFFNAQMIDSTGNVVASAPICYTRDGSFHVDKNGYLVNSQGYAVLGGSGTSTPGGGDPGGTPIKIEAAPTTPVYSNYSIDADGRIFGIPIVPDPTTGSDPKQIGTIRISKFPNEQGLVRQGFNLYQQGPESGAAINGMANAGGNGSLADNNIEASNVDLASEMVNMIIYQADYNANSKSVTAGNTMLETVINMVR
jgi:flagellar hook protein FlgE